MKTTDGVNMIVEAYKKLYSMACDQLDLLSEDRLAEFFSLSSRIQGIQQQVSTLNKRFLLTRATDVTDSAVQKAKAEISELQGLIEETYTKMEKMIAGKRDTLRQELVKLKKGQKAIRGYHSKDKAPPRFVQKIT